MMRYFSNIAGYNGVFICGDYPHWIFLTGRGEFRAHPMTIDGSIKFFAPFNNVNCPQGFLYFNRKVGFKFEHYIFSMNRIAKRLKQILYEERSVIDF